MANPARARQLAKQIMHIVAQAIGSEIKDPRLELVTVTDCQVTGDLHNATVFYTVRGRNIDDEPYWDAAANSLARARGQLRTMVGRRLGVRYTPTLEFEVDTVPEASAHLEAVLAKARQRDAEIAAQAEGAKYSGDADPYRKPEADQEEPGEW